MGKLFRTILFIALQSFVSSQFSSLGESAKCDKRYEVEESGSIVSPGYPDTNYGPNLNCTYRIIAPPGYVISYESVFMDIEDPDALNSMCVYDVLKIYNGNELWRLLCGVESIYLNSTTSNNLTIVFTSDYSTEGGGFNITWRKIDPAARPPSFDCNFDDPIALCAGWTNEVEDYQWLFTRSFTPSANTGPVQDHSKQSAEGRYAHIEGSKVKTNSTAILRSPQIQNAGAYCLRFWYHMYGKGIGGLQVVLIEGNDEETVIASYYGPKGDKWLEGEYTITTKSPLATIAFRGIRGTSYTSDLAIDDLSLRYGACDDPRSAFKTVKVIKRNEMVKLPDRLLINIPVSATECPTGMEKSGCTFCNLSCDLIGSPSGPVKCFPACVGGCACPAETPIIHNSRCIDITGCPTNQISTGSLTTTATNRRRETTGNSRRTPETTRGSGSGSQTITNPTTSRLMTSSRETRQPKKDVFDFLSMKLAEAIKSVLSASKARSEDK